MRPGVILTIVFLLAGCGTAQTQAPAYENDLRGAVFNPPRLLEDFTFASTTGEPFTLSEHRGQVILLYFGYRACPDVCPMTFSEMRRVYADLGEPADRLKIVFVTVDPERDSVEGLAHYMTRFHPDFIGLREEEDTVRQVMSQFGAFAEKQSLGDTAMTYVVDHTASLFLINSHGELYTQYLFGTDYRDITHDLQLILPEM